MVNLIEAQARERTDEVLEDTIWESARLGEEQWESLKVNESGRSVDLPGFCLRILLRILDIVP